MKTKFTTNGTLLKVKRHGKRLLWSLFFLAKALIGTFVLILAVSVTAICYVFAAPYFLYLSLKEN
jgi:hypothetical protein